MANTKKKEMNPDEFCKWLEGFLDATEGQLTERQLETVKSRLENVKKTFEFTLIPQIPQQPLRPLQPIFPKPYVPWCEPHEPYKAEPKHPWETTITWCDSKVKIGENCES